MRRRSAATHVTPHGEVDGPWQSRNAQLGRLFAPIWTAEEVPWFILKGEEICMMQLIGVYKPT